MKPVLLVVCDRSLTAGDGRIRRSARLYDQLAAHYRITALVRVGAAEPEGDAVLGPDFTERRVRRTAAENEWQQMALARHGSAAGDDALDFDRVTALNPPFMRALSDLAAEAAAAACVRPYAFGALRAVWDGPLVYDALELEYPARAQGTHVPALVAAFERLAALEERCAVGADLVLTATPAAARLCAGLYGVDPARTLALAPAFDAMTPGVLDRNERAKRRAETSLRGRPFALFAGSATPANTASVAALCAVAAGLPEMTFVVAGRVATTLPPLRAPANLLVTGPVDDATLIGLLEAATAVVHPCGPRPALARKLLDAIAHGAPVVTTPEGAAGVLHDGIDADVVPAPAFSQRLRALIATPERGEQHARAARLAAARAYPPARAAAPVTAALDALTRRSAIA